MRAAATVMILPRHLLSGPNGKLGVACIGCGGKGGVDARGVGSENVVAVCDVDERRAGGTFRRYANAKKFKDFRAMLDEMDKQIDAVTVSTPDHTHFPAAMSAIMRGKHVFCQKPLTHNVWEARAHPRREEAQGRHADGHPGPLQRGRAAVGRS